jgi:peptidoglycan/LPS O-acetylase OafA/YrhL
MNRQFGALSGLAMVLIVINHSIYFGTNYPEGWGYPSVVGWGRTFLSILQSFGWFAVPIFLFISGSFASYAAQGEPPRLSRKFLFSTLRHIVIPYIIWSLVFYVLVFFVNHGTYTPVGYIKNFLVGYPYHFVPLLVFYYILSPVLIRISRSYGLVLIALIALYQLILINILNPGTLGFALPAWAHYLAPPVIRTTLADWGIFFPLGLVYGLHAKLYMPWSKKFFWVNVGVMATLFVLGVLDSLAVIHLPLAHYLAPVSLMLLLPAIKRETIPFVRLLERIGRRSYGIYLTNLIVLNLVLIGLRWLIPGLFNIYIILFPLLFLIVLLVPLLVMEWMTKGPTKQYYRYVFG